MKVLFEKSLCSYSKDDDKPKKVYSDEPVEFEDAISETSFGKFNIFLMAFMLLVSSAFIYDTTVMSYTIPSAECDLNISLLNKGVLNAIVHAGMICSALFSGYFADTLGRKTVMFGGLAFDAAFNIVAMFSHSFILILICKFFSGVFMAGISTIELTMMAELHSAKYRTSLTMYTGVTFSCAMLTAPILAWLILTDPYDLPIGEYDFHSWQMFMGACSLPSILACCFFFVIPESPKFLASRNRTEEALSVMRKIYSINTGKPADTFPVKVLLPIGKKNIEVQDNENQLEQNVSSDNAKTSDAVNISCITKGQESQHLEKNVPSSELKERILSDNKKGIKESVRDGMQQMKPLFKSPYILKLLLMFSIQCIGITAQNAIRLWLPQLFKMMSEYTKEDGTFCDMISLGNTTIIDTPQPEDGICEPIKVAAETYVNSMIVAGVQIVIGTLASFSVNFIGSKTLLVSAMSISSMCCLALYWSVDQTQVTALASFNVAFSLTSVNCLLSTSVDLFPTSLRAMALCMSGMLARIGSIVGSLMFPALLTLGCLPPFLTVSCILLGGALLSLLLPVPNKHVT